MNTSPWGTKNNCTNNLLKMMNIGVKINQISNYTNLKKKLKMKSLLLTVEVD